MSAKIKGLTRSDKSICKLDLRSTVKSMIGNIKKLFLPKIEMYKKQVMLHVMLQGCTKYPMSKESEEIKIGIID